MSGWLGRQEVRRVVASGLVGVALAVITALLAMDAPRPEVWVLQEGRHQKTDVAAVHPETGSDNQRVSDVAEDGSVVDSTHRALTPRLVDSVTGKPIWWSTGILRLPQGALTSAGQGTDTRCSNGEECPDPLAP